MEIDLAVKFSTLELTLRPLTGSHISKVGKQQMTFKVMVLGPTVRNGSHCKTQSFKSAIHLSTGLSGHSTSQMSK